MDAEQTITEIERLERLYTLPDPRPLDAAALEFVNRAHDKVHAHSPWFRLWQDFGICCRPSPERPLDF